MPMTRSRLIPLAGSSRQLLIQRAKSYARLADGADAHSHSTLSSSLGGASTSSADRRSLNGLNIAEPARGSARGSWRSTSLKPRNEIRRRLYQPKLTSFFSLSLASFLLFPSVSGTRCSVNAIAPTRSHYRHAETRPNKSLHRSTKSRAL